MERAAARPGLVVVERAVADRRIAIEEDHSAADVLPGRADAVGAPARDHKPIEDSRRGDLDRCDHVEDMDAGRDRAVQHRFIRH